MNRIAEEKLGTCIFRGTDCTTLNRTDGAVGTVQVNQPSPPALSPAIDPSTTESGVRGRVAPLTRQADRDGVSVPAGVRATRLERGGSSWLFSG
jgi:hypothetical protein